MHGLATRSTNLHVTNCPVSGRGQGQVANFKISHPWNISGMDKATVVKFCVYQALTFGRPTIPKSGVAQVTWSILEFYTPLNFSWMAEDRIIKFCAQIDVTS